MQKRKMQKRKMQKRKINNLVLFIYFIFNPSRLNQVLRVNKNKYISNVLL